MVAKAEAATPLWITPLVQCTDDEPDVGRYETLQRLVTASPAAVSSTGSFSLGGEIETLLQVYIGPESDTPLWRRVVVRSGPLCPRRTVHASFQIPEGEDDVILSGNVLCWASFTQDRPQQSSQRRHQQRKQQQSHQHLYLCVLASPTLVCIWDVYPEKGNDSSVGEGHSISLPFEASSIHALEGGQSGLLIQRIETAEDYWEAMNVTLNVAADGNSSPRMGYSRDTLGHDHEEDDDGFVLGPPQPVRTSIEPPPTPPVMEVVPSLFSLSHPLDDVLPISYNSRMATATTTSSSPNLPPPIQSNHTMISDVFEKVLFSGSLSWVDPKVGYLDRKECHIPICVTYHIQKKR